MFEALGLQARPSEAVVISAIVLLFWRVWTLERGTATHERRISRLEGIDEADSR